MADKRRTEDEVIAELDSGMTIGIGGWGSRRKPMSLVRAILRSDLTDLHIVSYGGPDVGILTAAGKCRKVTYGFVSLDSIPLEPHFRAVRQAGSLPDFMELDEGAFYLGLMAAAHRVPFYPTRAGLGSSMLANNPELRTVVSPYDDGEELVALIDDGYAQLEAELAEFGSLSDGFVSYGTLTEADKRTLSDQINTLAEPLSQLTVTVLE